MPRFAILEHTGAPDDPAGRHYDLLLEAGDACRTWRLAELPVAGGPPVPAVELPPHRLAWLDHVAGEVSGGRGFARRIAAGEYVVGMSDATNLMDATRLAILITNTIEPMRLALTYDAQPCCWKAGPAAGDRSVRPTQA
ncbi:MAG: hypothetical protein ACKOOF_00040 [Planctomycetaceae bacterium]